MQVQTHRYLSEFSTFGIGGPIRYFLEVSSEEEMIEAFHWANKERIPLFILGKGSNSLFSDAGFDGLVILNKIHWIEWGEQKVRVGSGYSFSLLGIQTAKRGWSGLEFASGIPASVGGAIFMNAGANGKETSERLESVVFLTTQGEREVFSREEIAFGYRESMFQKKAGAIVEAAFYFESNSAARGMQLAIIDRRMKTQPLREKSAGCIFQNPPGSLSAGALIEQCGLKGCGVGGAQVSEVHANFIVNTKDASACDVKMLIEEVRKKVKEKTGIELELEVRIL